MNKIKISENFSLHEFQDKNTSEVKLDENLLYVLQLIRSTIGKGVIITSGYRTWETHVKIYKEIYGDKWSDKITKNSLHLSGQAVDFKIVGGDKFDMKKAIDICVDSNLIKGIGVGNGWLHIDTRNSDNIVTWRY